MLTTIHRPTQHPILPWEITDTIIDHLHSDIQTLGSCSAVCSEWLIRSRFHVFSTVQLWPWRVQRFFDLANSSLCTFVNQIRCIEVDDTQAVDTNGRRRMIERGDSKVNTDEMLFIDAMSQAHIPSLAHVRSIHVHNFDWTKLSLTEQGALRRHLAKFSQLQRLELHGAVFHDLREVVRIVGAFPALYHLTANITFMKYLEHTIASAMTNYLPHNLRSVELGTDDGIPVVLSSLAGRDDPQHIQELKLKQIRFNHLQYIQAALKKSGKGLQHLSLGFALDSVPKISKEVFIKALNFSHLSHLQTLHIGGLTLTKDPSSFEVHLSKVLQSIESSFLESVQLQIYLEDDTSMGDDRWCTIEHELLALHFFGMRLAVIMVDIPSEGSMKEDEVERWIREGMSDLYSRGALHISVVRERVEEDVESCSIASKD